MGKNYLDFSRRKALNIQRAPLTDEDIISFITLLSTFVKHHLFTRKAKFLYLLLVLILNIHPMLTCFKVMFDKNILVKLKKQVFVLQHASHWQ